MKLFTGCLLFLFGMCVAAPVRATRGNALSFLNDVLDTAAEKTTAETAYKKPQRKPVKEQDSQDVSDEESMESFDTNAFTDSHEIMTAEVEEKDKATSRREPAVGKGNMGLMDGSSSLDQDLGEREPSRPQGQHQASKEPLDFNSEERKMDPPQAEHLPGKQILRSSGGQMFESASPDSGLQREATPGKADGLNGMVAQGQSREMPDWDSLEDSNARPPPVGTRGEADYDETRELISSETYPIETLALPEHISALGLMMITRSSAACSF